MEKWCQKCHRSIMDPGTSDMTKYAKFWRDNRCYYCNSLLINKSEYSVPSRESNEIQNNIPPHISKSIPEPNSKYFETIRQLEMEFVLITTAHVKILLYLVGLDFCSSAKM